jgi:CDP-diacylglycerol--glycerol-3-phosphate 3-phosphatidyltransferase
VNVSHKFNSSGVLELPTYNVNPLQKKVKYVESILQQFKMFKYDNRVKIPSGEKLDMKEYFDNLEKYNNNYRYRETTETLLEFNSNKKEFLKYLIEENDEKSKDIKFLKEFSDTTKKGDEDNIHNNDSRKVPMIKPLISQKVLIFPSFQFANINQLDDKEILTNLISSDLFSRIRLSSGYINLSDFILNIWKDKDYAIQVVTSSPQANSFYKAGFLKKNIPYFYRRYEQMILNRLNNKIFTKSEEDHFRKSSFSLNEFHRDNWTFHSKGLWFYEKGKEYPTMTVIGSSNYSKHSLI